MIPSRLLVPALLAGLAAHAAAVDYPLLTHPAPAKALVPSAANGGNDAGYPWRAEADPANIASWLSGNTGVGYDADTANGGNYIPHVGFAAADITTIQGMRNVNGSIFIRIPFEVSAADLPLIRSLKLQMRYDDGFVAWLNGTKIHSVGEPASLAWNSITGGSAVAANLTGWEDADVSAHVGLLHAGTNLLAIQGMNNALNSSDLLIVPQLVGSDALPPPPVVWPTVRFVEVPGAGPKTRIVAIRHAGDGTGRLFLAQQNGVISISGVTTPFMTVPGVRFPMAAGTGGTGGNEEGLLGLAFPPGHAQSGRFYVTHNTAAGNLVLRRFTTVAGNPNLGDPNSGVDLLPINHPTNSNHNGGDIHFGPDGYLYWATGDGGSGGDPPNNAQTPSSLLGKMMRLDVEGAAAAGRTYDIPPTNPWSAAGDGVMDQIFHFGLRNPWRWSFDRLTGDLWIGDVGQDAFEEIDMLPAGLSGRNFGWRRREGMHDLNMSQPMGPGTVVEPVTEQAQNPDFSVTGGFVYRGSRFPRMQGIYFFGDYQNSRLYGLQQNSAGTWVKTIFAPAASSVAGFGENEAGEIHFAQTMANGRVYTIEDDRDAAYLTVLSRSLNPTNNRLTFTFGAAFGKSYQVEVSENMQTWTPSGTPLTAVQASNYQLTYTEPSDPPAGVVRRYFRAREL